MRGFDMSKALGSGIALTALLTIGLGSSPVIAGHNDWGLPLVGGLVGGAGLTYFATHAGGQSQAPKQQSYVAPPTTTYVTPVVPPASSTPAAPSAATVEHELNVLDDLAAKGYITKQEYQDRRQALLNQL